MQFLNPYGQIPLHIREVIKKYNNFKLCQKLAFKVFKNVCAGGYNSIYY